MPMVLERADLRRDRAGGLVVRDRRVQLPDQRGPGGPQPVQVPGREAVPAVGRELLDAGELTVHGGEVPVLERRVDQPDVAPQLGERLAGPVGDLARPAASGPPFGQELRRAQRQVPRVHGVEQRVGVVGALGEREGFGRQVPRPVSRAGFRREDRLPGAQPRAQRGVLGRHGTQRPGAQRVDGRGRGGIAHPGDHQGGRRERDPGGRRPRPAGPPTGSARGSPRRDPRRTRRAPRRGSVRRAGPPAARRPPPRRAGPARRTWPPRRRRAAPPPTWPPPGPTARSAPPCPGPPDRCQWPAICPARAAACSDRSSARAARSCSAIRRDGPSSSYTASLTRACANDSPASSGADARTPRATAWSRTAPASAGESPVTSDSSRKSIRSPSTLAASSSSLACSPSPPRCARTRRRSSGSPVSPSPAAEAPRSTSMRTNSGLPPVAARSRPASVSASWPAAACRSHWAMSCRDSPVSRISRVASARSSAGSSPASGAPRLP